MKLGLLKNWKILLWLLLIIAAVAVISPKLGVEGIQLDFVAQDSPVQLSSGDIIFTVNGVQATQELLEKEYDGIVSLSTSKGTQLVWVNGTLGISGREPSSTNLKFGLDVEGGVRSVLLLNESDPEVVEQSISTIQTRINLFGLREASIRSVREGSQAFVEITMTGADLEEITKLVESQGHFEARIPIILELQEGSASLTFKEDHAVTADGDRLLVDGNALGIGEQTVLDGVTVILEDVTEDQANITTIAFTSDDIDFVYFDPQHSGMQPQDNGYSWFFQVRLAQEGAERFAEITGNLEVLFGPGMSGLSSPIELYLDGELVDTLSISSDLKGQIVREPSVTGFATTIEEAETEQRRLQSILRSGALPTGVEVVKRESISPLLGEAFLRNMMIAVVAAIAAVSVVVSARYRKVKVVLPIIVTAFSEVLIILGMSVIIGWTLDMASMAAIIAILGTGMDAQIIMIDQAIKGRKQEYGRSERMKRAFFMVMAAGGTTIAAMIPLLGLGLGVLRGFAITTIFGVLIGILITRPAFGEMIKKII